MNESKARRAVSARPRMTIRVEGPRVGEGRLSVVELAEIVTQAQQALKRVGRVLYGEESSRPGRDRADVEKCCELFLVGWKPGSAVAELELAEPPAQMEMLGHIGAESLTSLVDGLSWLGDAVPATPTLPRGIDRGVSQSVAALAQVLDHGIDRISIEAGSGTTASTCAVNAALRERLMTLLGRQVEVSGTARTGRLEELNGHGGLTGRLWEADGTKWLCHFKAEHQALLPEAWMRMVRVRGRASVEEGRERRLFVESVDVLDDEAGGPPGAAPFWESQSLDELAARQGVTAVDDLDSVSALWPEADDADALLQYVPDERAGRRVAGGGAA